MAATPKRAEPRRGGAAEGRLRRRARGTRRRTSSRSTTGAAPPPIACRSRPICCAGSSCASPSRTRRSRSRRCEGRRPHRAAPRQRAEARHRPGALHRRHARAAGTLHAALVLSPVAHGRLKKLDRRRAAPGVVAVLGRRRHSRQERRRRRRHATSRCSPIDRVVVRRPAAGDGGGDDARRGAPCRRARDDRDRCGAAPILDIETALRGQGLRAGAADPAARRSRRRAEVGAAHAERRVQRRRAGAFLSRRPDRLRPAGRGRRHRRPFLDPASDRGAAHLRPPAGLRLQPRDGGGAPAGRRLRRQGEQRLVGRGRGGAGRATTPAGR